ncbi:TetR/AcrR family transcriptional regulator [Vagococcus humatus]|nr:TetR/AcrR family transcriptional regulator [Vagococcus humatus]
MSSLTREQASKITYDNILAVATDLFMRDGYQKTSTRDIAKICQITQPNLYHHFKNKEVLYIAVLTRFTEGIQEDLVAISRKNDPVQDRLLEMILYLLQLQPTNLMGMLQDIATELSYDNRLSMYQLFEATYKQPLTDLLKKMPIKDEFTHEEIVNFILYHLAAMMSIDNQLTPVSLKEQANHFVKILFEGALK